MITVTYYIKYVYYDYICDDYTNFVLIYDYNV